MTSTEHLQRIKAKCLEKIESTEREMPHVALMFQKSLKQSIAGWRATIVAIDNFQLIHEQTDTGEYAAWDAMLEIITAWPEEIL